MWRSAHDTYLEERILAADPVELVDLLYQAAIAAVGDARRHLAERQILPRARSISKACDILMELGGSLDFERGGEMSVRLSQLYGYMHRRLVEANFRQSDAPLAEVAGLMGTLMEGWAGVKAATRQTPPRENRWVPTISAEADFAQASGVWRF
jgi:flagellar protein FliS